MGMCDSEVLFALVMRAPKSFLRHFLNFPEFEAQRIALRDTVPHEWKLLEAIQFLRRSRVLRITPMRKCRN